MIPRTIRIGTRSSPLAMWQARRVAESLHRVHAGAGLVVDLVEIKTLGDRDRDAPLAAIGGAGVFTKEIQRALLDGSVDVAVHSLKDLPTKSVNGLTLAAVPEREDLADALISPRHQTIERLPPRAKVGTGSPRRRAQLLHLRPDLEIVAIRGNVETRLAHAWEGRLDAIVLAIAGLRRLGLDVHVTQRLEPPEFLPAVGQGALGIECRADDVSNLSLLSRLECGEARSAVEAERQALAGLEGSCLIALGAWGRVLSRDILALDVEVFDLDGRERLRVGLEGNREAPDVLGGEVAQRLRELGAERLLRAGRSP